MYKLIEINFNVDYLSDETLYYHYELYKGYINRLNNLLIINNYDYKYTKEELIDHIDIFNIEDRDDILFNLGGVLNHEIYFSNISNNIIKIKNNKFLDDINLKYGSLANFKNIFKTTSSKLVGSGYTSLVLDQYNNFKIINVLNQETPYIYNYKPLIMLDIWEHAYYLDYNIKKNDYINRFLDNLNLSSINNKYEILINN